MAEGVPLFDLAAKISADFKDTDRGLTETQKKVLSLAEEFRKTEAAAKQSTASMGGAAQKLDSSLAAVASLQRQRSAALIANWKKEEQAAAQRFKAEEQGAKQAAQAVGRDLQSALQDISPGLGSIAAAAGPITITVGAVAALAAGLGVAAVGMFEFTKSAAEMGQEIYNAQVRTNMSVASLGAFKVAAEESGGSLSSVTMGLGMFESKQEQANEGSKKMSALFKALHVDVKDNELGFRQLLGVLVQLQGSMQIGVAKEFFGRGYRDILAAIKEIQQSGTHNLDDYIVKLTQMGLILGDDDVKASHAFEKQLIELSAQWDVMKVKIGEQWMPIVSKALTSFSGWLLEGKDSVVALAGEISKLITVSEGLIKLTPQYWAARGGLFAIGTLESKYGGAGSSTVVPQSQSDYNNDLLNMLNAGKSSGGLKGGGGQWQGSEIERALRGLHADKQKNPKDELAPYKNILDQVNRALDFFGDKTEHAKIEQEFLAHGIDKLTGSLKAQAEYYEKVALRVADVVDTKKALADIDAQEKKNHDEALRLSKDIFASQREQLQGPDSVYDAVLKYEQKLTDLGQALDETTSFQLRFNAVLIESKKATKELATFDNVLPGPAYKTQAQQDAEAKADQARLNAQIAGSPDRITSAEFENMQKRMKDFSKGLARDLTDAIRVGFQDGAAAGLKSLLLSFLDTLAQMAEKWLASSIFNMLSSVLNPAAASGGGGFWSKILGSLLGIGARAAGGGAGGGGGDIGGVSAYPGSHAMGLSYVPFDNYPALLHKGEKVLTAKEARSGNGPSHTFIVQINVPNIAAAGSQATQYQTARQFHGLMARAMLTG